jgi:hypothetical protein
VRLRKPPTNAVIGYVNDDPEKPVHLSPEYRRHFDFQVGKPAVEESQTVSAGPAAFTKIQDRDGFYVVEGGTVTTIELQRGINVVTTYDLGGTAGQYVVPAGDVFQVTYTVAPTITFFPM